MEHILRSTSAFLFGLNYCGLLFPVFTFVRESDAKQQVFQGTLAAHFLFYMNGMLLSMLKFKAFPYHLGIQVLNDTGTTMTCLPMYVMWAKADYHKYFDKVEGEKPTMVRPQQRQSGSAAHVQVMDAD